MESQWLHIDGLVQDCSNSIANALELLQSYTKPWIWNHRSGALPVEAMACYLTVITLNTLRPRQNGCHFADNIFKWIFFNEKVWISIKISLKFVPQDPINNIPALVQIMAWCRPGDKPLSGPMMVRLPTHICVTRPQWVKTSPELMLIHHQWNHQWNKFHLLHSTSLNYKYIRLLLVPQCVKCIV